MVLNGYGLIVKTEWTKTSEIRTNIELDEFIVMPTHLHGIIFILDDCCEGTGHRAPTMERFGKPTSNSIPTIIRSFKSTVTKKINEIENSLKWDLDKENPLNKS